MYVVKKPFLRKAIYLTLVLVTVFYALYEYKKSLSEEEQEKRLKSVFPSIKVDDVISISFYDEKEHKKSLLVQTTVGKWLLKEPIEDIASPDLVQDWLTSFLKEEVSLIKSSGVDWAEYGLNQDTKSIKIGTKDGKSWDLNLSHYSAYDGSFFIKRGQELLLGGTGWGALTNKKGGYFRSYKLVNESKAPNTIEYRSKDFSAKLQKQNHKWQWVGPPEGLPPLSQKGITSYWSNFSNLYFEKDIYPDTFKLRQQFKLTKPLVTIYIGFPSKGEQENTRLQIQIGPEVEGKFYALLSDRGNIVSLSKEQMKDVFLTEKKIVSSKKASSQESMEDEG